MPQTAGLPGMQYRQLTWQERGFDSEQAEIDDMRNYVQALMQNTEPPDIADSILILANICENRLIWTHNPSLKDWYTRVAKQLRETLDIVCTGPNPKPNDKLENGYLYMPDTETLQ
jgi:hypothetical protein